ncbi:ferric/cupric reductase transmembrane component 2 [[Candida] railenensis]|uniref:ferric-chelate reductase (NADPH) n=1 Tax=[Candida] railenensis TaxID=45579 RepID=A0A9P0QWC7_9ASCO|nr:ferric/cupric reductase transmembrane component 2 [[Candida] railenensis]
MNYFKLVLLIHLGYTLAEDPELVHHLDQLGYKACKDIIEKNAILFDKKDKQQFCNVKNQPALGTMAHCIIQGYNETKLAKPVMNYFINSCKKYNLTAEKVNAAYLNASDYLVDVSEVENFDKKSLFSYPLKLKTKKIKKAYESNYTRYININYATWFSTALLSYWFFVIFLAGTCNLAYFICPVIINKLFNGKFSKAFRRYISLPALLGKTHAAPVTIFDRFIWLLPTRLESIVVMAWYVLAIAFNISHVDHTADNFIWNSKQAEMGRKVADRSGIICTFLIPPTILFAGRNNFLQWISGWQFSRMVIFHKWSARAMFLTGVVHTVAMSFSGVALGKFVSRNKKPYVIWGYVAIVAGLILMFQSFAMIRRKYYEVFIGTHILFAIIFVMGAWIHTKDEGYENFFFAAAAVWGLDRALRFGRLFAFGVQTASVELVAGETLRVTVPRPKYWKPFPGCHAFVHFFKPTCFWQSHPFTIVDSVTEANSITFYMKIKGGMTHSLCRFVAQQPNKTTNIKVSVEGPYGTRLPLDRFKNAIFFAGGNGIPGLYSEAVHLANNGKSNVKLYWIIRNWISIEWFYTELKKLENTRVQPIIYITQPQVESFSSTTIDSEEDSEKGGSENDVNKISIEGSTTDFDHSCFSKLRTDLSFIKFCEGRPNIEEIVLQELVEAEGSTGIAACAHGSMLDDLRVAIINNLDTSKDRVEYYEELQQW